MIKLDCVKEHIECFFECDIDCSLEIQNLLINCYFLNTHERLCIFEATNTI